MGSAGHVTALGSVESRSASIWARRASTRSTHVGGRAAGEALVDVRQRDLGLAEEAVLDDPEEAERVGVRGVELGRPRQLFDGVEEQVAGGL